MTPWKNNLLSFESKVHKKTVPFCQHPNKLQTRFQPIMNRFTIAVIMSHRNAISR